MLIDCAALGRRLSHQRKILNCQLQAQTSSGILPNFGELEGGCSVGAAQDRTVAGVREFAVDEACLVVTRTGIQKQPLGNGNTMGIQSIRLVLADIEHDHSQPAGRHCTVRVA